MAGAISVQKGNMAVVSGNHHLEIVKKGAVNTVKVKQGEKFKIIENINDEEILADNVIAVRSGNDLQLSYADNTVVSVENFYATEHVSVELPSSSPNAVFHLNSSSNASFQPLADGSTFIYSSGNHEILSQIVGQNNTSLQAALHEHMDFVNAPRFAESGHIANDALPVSGVTEGAVASSGISATQVLVGAVVLGGVGLAVGGGGGGGGSSSTPVADTTAPTAAITLSDAALKIGDASTVTITFSEAVNGFALSDLTAANGTLSNLVQSTTDPKVYTATFTPTANIEDTTNAISLATTYSDLAGNVGTIATSANYVVDTKAPTATITCNDSALKIGDTSLVTIAFSEVVTSFDLSDLNAPNGVLSNLQTSDNITYTATFTPTVNIEDTTNVISLATTYSDLAGNVGTIATSANYEVDTKAPVLTGVLAHGVSKTIVLTYDSPLDATHLPLVGDFNITTGSANAVTVVAVSANTVTLTLTNAFLATDTVVINYTGSGANAIQDIAGNDAITITNLGSGVVADGYVRGAQLWIDTNHDGQADYNTGVTTDANGNFFLPPSTPAGSIIAIGGVNIDTGVPNTMPLSAPEGSTVINPLTTLVQAVVTSTGVSASDASASVVAALGLTTGTDLTTFDPIQSNDVVAQKAAATIATISIMADANSTDTNVQTTIMDNLVTQIAQASQADTTVDLGDSGVVGSLLDGVTDLDVAAQSSIADASNAVSTATDLAAISQAQSQYLDTIAPGSSTITVTSPTNDTTPSIRVNLDITSTDGKAVVENDTVSLVVAGVTVATHTITGADLTAGYVTFNALTLTEGSHTISAKVIDQSGNMGTAYPLQTVVIDTTAPTAPTVGTVATDNVINAVEEAGSVTISGTTEAGSTVVIGVGADYQNMDWFANATVTGTTWSYTLSAPTIAAMGEGAETLTIVSTDTAGNTTTTTKNISVDTLAPTNTVTITSITDNVAPTTGVITAGSTTNDNTLEIAGTLSVAFANGEKLAVYDGSVLVGYATVTDTAWTLTTSSLSNATHSFTAVAIDAAGNAGTASGAFALTVNATVPTTTATITNGATITNDTTPTINGSVSADVAGEKVIIYDGTTKLGEATRTGTAWSFDTSALSDGTHTFTAVVENAGGNQGSKSSSYALAIDTVNPTNPTIAKVASDDVINLAEQTAGVTISGTTEAGSTVTVNGNNATVTGTTWSYNLLSTEMDNATETLTIVSTDAAGNTATTSKNISVDTLASNITIDTISTNNAINKAEKASSAFVSGTAEAGTTVILELGTNNTKSITADGTGQWSYILIDEDYKALGTEATIKATVVDSAGNSAFATQAITIDTVVPVLSPISLATDTGVAGDRKGNDTTPDFTFTAESGATIAYSLDGTTYSALTTGTGSVQTLSIPTLTDGDKDYTVYIKATDSVGNTTIRTTTYTLDTTAPTATITMSDTALKTGDTSIVTITFNESVSDFVLSDLSAQNGTLSNLVQDATNPKVYTATFTPTANIEDTSNVISLATTYTDIAGNTGTVIDSSNYAVDTKVPTATITLNDSALKIGDTSTVTITFSESVTAFELADLSAQNGALSNLTTSDNITYTATFTPTADIEDTTNVISLATTYTDTAGNAGTVATSDNYVIDTQAPLAPVVTLTTDSGTSDADTITNIGTVSVASESGATVEYSSDGNTWVSSQPTAVEGSNTLHVRQIDAAGNVSATTDFGFTLDTTAPYAMISMGDSSLKIGETSLVTISFIQKVTNFSNDDVTVQNGTLGTLTTNDNGTTWTGTFIPTANIEDTTNVISLGTAYTDIAGNTGTAATSTNYAIDTNAPTLTISAVSGGYVNNAEDENVVTISGTTTGVDDGQTVTVTLNAIDYTATVTSNAWTLDVPSSDIKALMAGDITLTANVSDTAGNAAIQASQTFVYDITAPTISSATTASVSENVATTTAVYTASADGANTYSLSGADASKFAINATTGAVTFVASPNYEAPTDSGSNNVYDIQVIATDVAGNASSAQAVAITVENVDVTVNTIATDGIINAVEKGAGVVLTGTNEPNASVTVNGNAATVTGTTWSYTLTPAVIAAMGEGSETLTISSGGQTITPTMLINTVSPTATITLSDSTLKVGETSTVTITFSEPVTSFSNDDVSVSNGTLGTFTSSDSTTWTATFTPTANIEDTTNVITLASNYTSVLAGNQGSTATSSNFTIDTSTPATPIVSLTTDTGTSSSDKITKTATVSVSNAESGATVEYSSDGSTWTTTQPTATEGSNTLHVRQTDVAGNVSATSDFTFTYDSTAPTKVDSSKGIFSVTDASHVNAINIDGAVGAKVILASDGTTIGTSSLFSSGIATLSVAEQSSLKVAQIKAFDAAGNAITTSSNIDLGTATGETLTATTGGDAMFGFGGTDTFVLKAANSGVNIIADYTMGEHIDFGTGETLWSNANAPTNWTIDANGMATYTGSTTPSDLATQFFTDFAAATGGSVGAVVGLVTNGKTYIFGEGATTANTDDLRVRIIDVADTTGLSISNGTVQLMGLGSPVAFDITSLLSSGITFFEAYPEYLESTTLSLQGTSGTYQDYRYDGTGFTNDGAGGSISVANNSGTLTITHDGQTDTLSFSNAHTVPSMSGVDTTGLNQVTATFTVISTPTVATTTDWWESGYTYWNGSASVPFTSLEQMVTTVMNPSNHYSFSVGSNDLHVMLMTGGTLHIAIGSDGSWTDSGTVVGGSWSNSGGYLTIVVDNVGTTAFKMSGATVMETEIDAVGSIHSETWYYGPTEAQFQDVLGQVFDANTPPANTDPMLTLHNGVEFALAVDENDTAALQTFTATDADNDALTYSLSGLDASAFDISATGVLTFKVAPNYETPTDNGSNNVYDVAVVVSDGQGGTDTQAVHINVKDVNEGTAISGFSATTLIANGQANFFTLYEGGQEFEHINLNNAVAGSWNDYLYTTPYFTPNESGSFTYVDNGNNTLTITDVGEGGKVSTLALSNAQTAVTSGGVDISAFGFNQVTATFTVTQASDLATTTDWWEANYYSGNQTGVLLTDLATLKDHLVTYHDYMNVWINDDVKVSLNSDGTLTEMVWDGKSNFVAGDLINGSWTLDATSLHVNVTDVGEAVFMVQNGTIMKTEIEVVGSTHSETLYYHDTMSAIDFADALGAHNSNITGYQGIVTEDNAHNYDLSFLDSAIINLDLSTFDASFDGKLASINLVDDGSSPDVHTITVADVLRLGVDKTLHLEVDPNDGFDDISYAGWQMDTNASAGATTTFIDPNQSGATVIIHTVVL